MRRTLFVQEEKKETINQLEQIEEIDVAGKKQTESSNWKELFTHETKKLIHLEFDWQLAASTDWLTSKSIE